MGLLSSIGRGILHPIDTAGKEISTLYHAVTHTPTSSEKRALDSDRNSTMGALNAQIKSYKDQTELARNELSTKKDEVLAERRRVDEKQIRSLRRVYQGARAGFLGSQQSVEPGMTSKLGG